MKEQTIGTQGLETVMLHDNPLAQDETDRQRAQRWASDVNQVRSSYQAN
jgi:hypothetical protein